MSVTPRKPVKYLSNKELLAEIAKCKNTYCSFVDEKYATYDEIVNDLADAQRVEGRVARLMTWDHIPLAPDKKPRPKQKNKTHENLSFPPFAHYVFESGEWREVGRSHWQGGLENGWFNANAGRATDRMGRMWMLFVERYARKGNWRNYTYLDEMRSQALTHLCHVGLQFDETKSQNPFAYYTTVIGHCFVRVENTEKKGRDLRDDLLIQSGKLPSHTRQLADHLAQMGVEEPKKLAGKRGRKSAAQIAGEKLSRNSQNDVK